MTRVHVAAVGVLLAAAAVAAVAVGATHAARPDRVLRVCADPNNLPFSNQQEQGFENRLAELIAEELDARVEYTWWAQRRGFFRNTLRAGVCDVVMGVPSSFELTSATRPYYRSTYVFVHRADAPFEIDSFDDPDLRRLKIGVQVVGDDGANTPPVHALSNRGITDNVIGYTVYGDYREPNPPARIIDAVVNGEVDVAVVWGPLAGYAARHAAVPLHLEPVRPQVELPFLPFVFDIAVGVRHTDVGLRQELEEALARRRADVDRLLAEYAVPRVDR